MPLVHSRSWERKGREAVVRRCLYFLRLGLCKSQRESQQRVSPHPYPHPVLPTARPTLSPFYFVENLAFISHKELFPYEVRFVELVCFLLPGCESLTLHSSQQILFGESWRW